MELATHSAPESTQGSPLVLTTSASDALSVSVVYTLSEAGRKASLLAGGNGRAHQKLTVQVPLARLHLVAVDVNGTARLKLQPWYRLTDEQRVVRVESPPTYDAPPTIEDLFREAARNYELERAYLAERFAARTHRREEDRELRAQLARDFLADPAKRAVVHPAPSSTRCVLTSGAGLVRFDRSKDEGIARDLPPEAHRRFRADLRARKERNLSLRAEQLALHQEKKRLVGEWVAEKGTPEQKGRHAAGVLPMEEVVDAMTDEAFAPVVDRPRYGRDGAIHLQAQLRASTPHVDAVVRPGELLVVRTDAVKATAAQWAFVQQLQTALPDASVTLREHRLSWRRDPRAPGITLFGAMVVRKAGPFTFRREFAAPGR